MPPLKSDVLDLCMVVNRTEALEAKVERLVTVISASAGTTTASVIPNAATSIVPGMAAVDVTKMTDKQSELVLAGRTYADFASSLEAGDFTVVEKKPKKKVPTSHHVLTGNGAKVSNTDQSKVKAVPRPKRLFAHVGRLHIDTTEEDLQSLLTSSRVLEPRCKKLKAKKGQVFTMAAFMVSCSVDSASVFYDKSIWPAGAELHDWYFRDRKIE